MKEFKGKVAVVTGAAAGIGRAIAERCAMEGMKVVLAGIRAETLAEAERELKARGATVLSVVTDVSKIEDVERLAQKTLDAFGAVHLVCNNAGVALMPGVNRTWEHSLAEWEWVLGVNLWGVIYGIRTFVPLMLRQNTEGHIVNVSSIAGLASMPYVSVYHSTKHAIVTITESLHYELELMKAKVKATVLCPGFVRTRIMECYRNLPPALRDQTEGTRSAPRMEATYRQAVESGLSPEAAADMLFEGIRNERLYVLTTNDFNPFLLRRTEDILAQRNPVMDPELFQALGAI